jgi:hypothetical protein
MKDSHFWMEIILSFQNQQDIDFLSAVDKISFT